MEFTLATYFQTERRLLKFFGTYPRNKSVINVKMCFTWVISILYFLTTLLIVDFQSFATTLAQSFVVFLQLGFMLKLLLFVYKGYIITECDELLKDYITLITSKADLKNLRNVHILAISYRFMCGIFVVLGLVIPLTQKSKRRLITPSWQPYDLDEDFNFWMTLLAQAIALIVGSMNNSSMDVIFYKLATILCCQIRILSENLRKIDFTVENRIYENKFKENVKHHITLLQVAKKTNEMYSGIALIQCLCSVPIICSVGFQVNGNIPFGSEQFLSMMIYFIAMILQISWYCWFGHKVLLESSKLDTALHMTNWYKSDVKFQKSITIFLEKQKIPIKFQAGGVFDLSLNTLIAILKSAVSYMTVLQQLLNEKDP